MATATAAASSSLSPSSSSSHSSSDFHENEVDNSATAAAVAPNFGNWEGRGRERVGHVVSELVGKLLSAILTCIFALVGSFVGAMTGALIGLATESGLFRGAGIGAISGAVFSIEVVESSLALWHSNGSSIGSVLFVIEIFISLLSGRLVREKVGPAMQNAVQSQMMAIDTPFQEVMDIFETGGTKGMSRSSVDKIPKTSISKENNLDTRNCCSVCLQDFQAGEIVRCLPYCKHMFHLPCIDSWLIRHNSCPLCRQNL